MMALRDVKGVHLTYAYCLVSLTFLSRGGEAYAEFKNFQKPIISRFCGNCRCKKVGEGRGDGGEKRGCLGRNFVFREV